MKHFQKVVENNEEHDELLREEKKNDLLKGRKKIQLNSIENVRISLVFAEITSDVMRIKKKSHNFIWHRTNLLGPLTDKNQCTTVFLRYFHLSINFLNISSKHSIKILHSVYI